MGMPDMSKLQVETERDKDIFQEDIGEVFPQNYGLTNYVSVGLDSTYVLFLDSSNGTIAAGLSNGFVNTYSYDLVKKDSIKVTEDSLSGLVFSPKDPSLFYTSSTDMCVKLWDLRTGESVKKYADTSAHLPGGVQKPLTAFSVNASDSFLTAGTEQVKGESYLLFWDARSEDLLGGYWNTHLDDITTLTYHPSEPDKLASGSVDGVVNVYDVSQSSEDEALTESINTESSVQKIKWYEEEDSSLAIITHTEDVHLWKVSDPSPGLVFKREQVALSGLKRSSPESAYVVDAHFMPGEGLRLLCGSRCGSNSCLRLSRLRKSRLKPLADLSSPKIRQLLVRCSLMDPQSGDIYTGGESGIISKWSLGVQSDKDDDGSSLKTSSSKKSSHKSKPY